MMEFKGKTRSHENQHSSSSGEHKYASANRPIIFWYFLCVSGRCSLMVVLEETRSESHHNIRISHPGTMIIHRELAIMYWFIVCKQTFDPAVVLELTRCPKWKWFVLWKVWRSAVKFHQFMWCLALTVNLVIFLALCIFGFLWILDILSYIAGAPFYLKGTWAI